MAGLLASFTMANSKGLYPRLGKATGTRKRRKRTPPRPPMRRASSKSKRPARLKKGSAAAKAWMAKIRRKRRR